jgi:hypothetical protein
MPTNHTNPSPIQSPVLDQTNPQVNNTLSSPPHTTDITIIPKHSQIFGKYNKQTQRADHDPHNLPHISVNSEDIESSLLDSPNQHQSGKSLTYS